jgi:hypothetical protein
MCSISDEADADGMFELARRLVGVQRQQRFQRHRQPQRREGGLDLGRMAAVAQAGQQRMAVDQRARHLVHGPRGDAADDARAHLQRPEQLVLQQAVARARIDGRALGDELDAAAADDVLGGLDAAGLARLDQAAQVMLVDGGVVAHADAASRPGAWPGCSGLGG